jgi:hypothetical protein
MLLITYFSILWRNRIDVACIAISQWAEEIMLGKKTLSESFSSVRDNVVYSLKSAQGTNQERNEAVEKIERIA